MAYLRGLTTPVTKLNGVGPAAKAGYAELGIFTFSDLLLLAPRTWEDRSIIQPIGNAVAGESVNTLVQVVSHSYFGLKKGQKRTLKIIVRDVSGEGDGRLSLLCFGRNFLERSVRIGGLFYLYGTVTRSHTEWQCSQFELHPANPDGSFPKQFGRVLPVYPLRGALTQRLIRNNIAEVLAEVDRFADELPRSICERHGLMTSDEAIRAYHFPRTMAELARARKTLALTELFYMQLIARRRRAVERRGYRREAEHPHRA